MSVSQGNGASVPDQALVSDQAASRLDAPRFDPSRLRACDACAGTGRPSPWEWDHFVWTNRVPQAVCGSCRGSGVLTRWGFRLSQKKTAAMLNWLRQNPGGFMRFYRDRTPDIVTEQSINRGAYVGETSARNSR